VPERRIAARDVALSIGEQWEGAKGIALFIAQPKRSVIKCDFIEYESSSEVSLLVILTYAGILKPF
jgi:hypothetical protein